MDIYEQLKHELHATAEKPIRTCHQPDAAAMAYLTSIAEDSDFEESEHPRTAKGGKGGGQFTKKPETLAKEDERDNLSKNDAEGESQSVSGVRKSKKERIRDRLEEAEKQGSKRVLAEIARMKEEFGGSSQNLLDAVFDRLQDCNEKLFWAIRRGETGNRAKFKNLLDAYYKASENISQNRGIAVTKNTSNLSDARKEARKEVFRVANTLSPGTV